MNHKNGSDYVLILILIILTLPVIFLLGLLVGSGVRYSELTSSASIATWVSAVATLAIAVLTLVLAKETWQLRLFQFHQLEVLRKNSIRPEIDVYLSRSKTNFNVMNVVVENMGSGVARNVTFNFEGSDSGKMRAGESLLVERLNKLEIFTSGIRVLGMKRQKRSFLFMNHDIYDVVSEGFFDICLTINVEYEDADGDLMSATSVWDFSEFKGASELGYGDPADKVAKHLEKISKTLTEYNSGASGNRVKVDVFSELDRKKEVEEIKEYYSSWEKNHQKGKSGDDIS